MNSLDTSTVKLINLFQEYLHYYFPRIWLKLVTLFHFKKWTLAVETE